MKAAVAMDAWKLPIFERHLTKAGLTFVNVGGKVPGTEVVVPGTIVLTVETDRPDDLHAAVLAAVQEAATLGEPNQ